MKRVIGILPIVFVLIWPGALGLYLVGTFGWFGVERDPLSGVFLLPLGLPWVLGADLFPEPLWPWLAALCPGINLLVLIWLRRRVRRG